MSHFTNNFGKQFLIASTAFVLLNIIYLFFLTQAPTLEKNNFAITFDQNIDQMVTDKIENN